MELQSLAVSKRRGLIATTPNAEEDNSECIMRGGSFVKTKPDNLSFELVSCCVYLYLFTCIYLPVFIYLLFILLSTLLVLFMVLVQLPVIPVCLSVQRPLRNKGCLYSVYGLQT